MSNKLNIIIVWYNEEKNLPKCFGSIKNFSDDIELNVIYCDQSSIDNSVKIAKDFWINIRNHPKYGMAEFSRERVVNEELKNWDWILILDADNWITRKLAREISKVIDDNLCDVGLLPINFHFMNVKTSTNKEPRLFKKGAVKLQNIPHNGLIIQSDKIRLLKNELINENLNDSWCELKNLLEKLNRYTTIEVDKVDNMSFLKILYWMFIKPIIWFFWFWIRWWYFFKWIPWRILAFHNAAYEFFRYAKYYEKLKSKNLKTNK